MVMQKTFMPGALSSARFKTQHHYNKPDLSRTPVGALLSFSLRPLLPPSLPLLLSIFSPPFVSLIKIFKKKREKHGFNNEIH